MDVGAIERVGLLASFLALGPQMACGSSAPAPIHDGGGGGGAAGARGAGDAAEMDAGCDPEPSLGVASPVCNTLTNAAPSVPFTVNPGGPPTFTGGEIRDGLYIATTVEGYGGATPTGRRLTLAITGAGTQLFWNGDLLDGTAQNIEETFAANTSAAAAGDTLTLTTTCASVSPAPFPASMTYSASATTLLLAVVGSGSSVTVTTYARQGCP